TALRVDWGFPAVSNRQHVHALALADDAALACLMIAAAQHRARLPSRAFQSRGRGHARAASNDLRTPDILRAPTTHRYRCSMAPRRHRRHGPNPECRRALELLASCRDGCTEAIMIAHGFAGGQLNEFVRAGPATATAERAVGPLIIW